MSNTGAKLYEVQRTVLQIRDDVVHYRYDIVNALTLGNVLSMFSTKALPPLKIVERCTKLNEVWGMTSRPVQTYQKVEQRQLAYSRADYQELVFGEGE